MIGVVASQILGGGWALSLFGVNKIFSMVVISLLIFILSVIDIGKLSKVFFYMLMFSSVTLLMVLFYVGIGWLPVSITGLFNSIGLVTLNDLVGVITTTILVTFIGMDFHQFIVKAKDADNAVKGAALGGVVLLALSALLLAVVNGAIETGLIGGIADAKQTVPSILLNYGNAMTPFLGIIFSLPLVFVAAGSGSGVTRIVAKTISDLGFSKKIKMDNRLLTVLMAFSVSLTGSSIINLIVAFYAIYVASVFIPFILFVLDRSRSLYLPRSAIRNSIIGGLIGSFLVFINRFIPGSFLADNQAAYIMLAGFSFSTIAYILSGKFHNVVKY
jgi:SSS family solute:Na+ symporter